MAAVLPYPPLHKDAKFVMLSDWDGTITDRDSNDLLTDELGFGYEKRRALNKEVLAGTITYKDSFHDMLKSVPHSFEYCKQYMVDHIKLDPGFEAFYNWCKANDVPVVIVSSGMEPNIRAVLSHLLSPEEAQKIDIIANGVKYLDDSPDGKQWEIIYRHPESHHGHDKSKAILPYRDLESKPTLFFCGDGVSDLSAARHADVLFTKIMANGDSDLQAFCKREGIPHVGFRDFTTVLEKVKEVVVGGKTPAQVLKEAGN